MEEHGAEQGTDVTGCGEGSGQLGDDFPTTREADLRMSPRAILGYASRESEGHVTLSNIKRKPPSDLSHPVRRVAWIVGG